MFLFNVLLWAVISGGFIIWALADCCGCPYLKSYFQRALSLWLVLWQINNITQGFLWVSKDQDRTTCLWALASLSFSKASNAPAGDVSLVSTGRIWLNTLPEIHGALPRDCFLCQWHLSVAPQDMRWLGQPFKRISAHACNPWEKTNHQDLRWRKCFL